MRQSNAVRLAAVTLGVAVVAALVVLVTTTFAQEKGPNEEPKHPTPGAKAQAVGDLALAAQLAAYGERNKDALALMTAARIVKNTPTQELEGKPETIRGEGATDDGKKDGGSALDAKNLLDAATRLSGEDATLKTLAARIAEEAGRGAVGGPRTGRYRLWGRCKNTFAVTFRGGEIGRVTVRGDGDTDLDLYVYDENGNLIVADRRASDFCSVRFCPRWTGPFRIEVHNLGRISNIYRVWTN
ncbi:MAG: hypothetical protein ACE5JG_04915 [Planctomycetota bacterium]